MLKVHAVEPALPPLQSKELAKKPHLVKQTNEALLKLLPGQRSLSTPAFFSIRTVGRYCWFCCSLPDDRVKTPERNAPASV